jgi:hypothetical protein
MENYANGDVAESFILPHIFSKTHDTTEMPELHICDIWKKYSVCIKAIT